MSKPFSTYERAAFKTLLDVVQASQAELGAAIGRLENGGTALSRSYVSQVLGGGRGSDNLDVAERFRRGALVLVEAFLKKSGTLTARGVRDFLHDLRRALTDEELADEMVKALLVRLAGLSPEPPKSFYVPTGALPDDARNRVETTALRDAVRCATSQPHFNLHVSGPRFSGTSTVLRAVEAAWKAHAPGGHVCYFDCAVDVLPFSPQFRWNMGDTKNLPGKDEEPGKERVKNTLARLTGELAVELVMPGLAGNFTVPRELFIAVRTQLKALETSEATPRRRLVILDGLDPTDVPLAKAMSEVAVALNDLRTGPRGISVVVGTRYAGDLLGKLEPSPRSSSSWVSERFHQVCTDGFSSEEAKALAEVLAEPSSRLEGRLLAEATEPKPHDLQPTLLHATMWQLRQANEQNVYGDETASLFDAMTSGDLRAPLVPAGVRAFVEHVRRVNEMLAACGVGKDGTLLTSVSDEKQEKFRGESVPNFIRSAGWVRSSKYRWQWLEDAWDTAKK